MKNRNVGFMILGIAALVVVIVLLFNSAMKEIVDLSCSMEHAATCPMYTAINKQTYLALGIIGLLVIVSLVLIFGKPEERIIVKKVKGRKTKKKIDTSGFRPEDKKVLKLVQEKKAAFQADLIEKTGFGKAKMTRIIDRLEGKDIVERKRRGMTNVVVLKD
jgi:uncharacterized membrane protein